MAGTNYASLNYTTTPGNTLTISMGNTVTEKPSLNDCLQPTGLQVNSAAAGSLLTLGLFPCPAGATSCATGNNGNLQSQTITIPNPSLSVTQTYSYDNLNRLTTAVEKTTVGSTQTWAQNYGYVGNGNRYVSSNQSLPALTSETPQAASWYSTWTPPAGCAPWHTNQINGWCYDQNGNVLGISSASRSFIYDAENRQVSANISGTIANYVYDGLGQRVSKTVGGASTNYVYDAFGNLAAEYGTVADPSPCGTPTCYVTVDHLGSARLLTDATGSSNVRRYDYQPFGAEIPASYASRTTALGYMTTPDGFGPKFTGQSRDPETGLDCFQVRHMSGGQGRFQSVDPGNAGANPGDPQTWNAYAYVGNNPLSYTDPSGKGAGELLCAGGPVGCGVGVAIDVGLALWGIFGRGHTPTLANFPFPNQIPGVSPTSGSASSDDPWNEQAPTGGSGGPFGIGGLYGSGNTGPFVFSLTSTQTMPWPGAPGWPNIWPNISTLGGAILGAAGRVFGLGVGIIASPSQLGGKDEIIFERANNAKAPGMPTAADGYAPPKRGAGANGEMVKNPNGPGRGWIDSKGNVWVPTGTAGAPGTGTVGEAHGGPHWDVQLPNGGHYNVYPGGRNR